MSMSKPEPFPRLMEEAPSMHHRDNQDAMSSEDGSVVSFGSQDNHRDEVAAVQRFSRRDTRRIRLWRLVVVVAMLLTGAGVTTWT